MQKNILGNKNIYKFECIINIKDFLLLFFTMNLIINYIAFCYETGLAGIIKSSVFTTFLLLLPYLIFLFNFYGNKIYKIIRNEDNLTLTKFQNLKKVYFNYNLTEISQITAKLLDGSFDILEICLYSGEKLFFEIPKIQDRENFERFFDGTSFKYQLTDGNENEPAREQNTNNRVFETRQRNFYSEILIVGLIIFVIIFFQLNKIMTVDIHGIISCFMFLAGILILSINIIPIQKLTKENNRLIIEKQIFYKKIHKVINIDEIKQIKISVEDYAIRKIKNDFYLTLRFFIELKNVNSHHFSYNIHRLKVSRFLKEAIIFFKGTKISLSEYPDYMKFETEKFIEPLLKENNTINRNEYT